MRAVAAGPIAAQAAGWAFGGFCLVLAVLLLLRGRIGLAIPFLYLAALHIPAVPLRLPVWAQVVTTVIAYLAYGVIWFGGIARQETMFRTPGGREAVLAEYDRKMDEWPVEWMSRYVETAWGSIHAVEAGPADAPAVILLHAASMSAWSWKPNVAGLAAERRVIAVDLPGEPGRSSLASLARPIMGDEDIAAFWTELFDALGVEQAALVGASAGGHQAMRIALLLPERVERITLLGPMGIANPTPALVRMTAAMLLPIGPVDRLTTRWALGTDERIRAEAYPWFSLVLRHVVGRPTPPRRLTDEQLQSLRVPVLLVLAENDNLVGPAGPAAARAGAHIPDCRIEILPGGHLVGMERSDEVNQLLAAWIQ